MLLDYLYNRGIKDRAYLNYVKKQKDIKLRYRLASINDFDFMVSQLFDESEAIGVGLIVTNEILGTNRGQTVAIGAIEGDDIICFDVPTGSIILWMIESGNGENIKIADSFEEFMDKCCK